MLNCRRRGACGVFDGSGDVRRVVVGKRLGLVEYVRALAAYGRAGTRRSRIGAPAAAAWRRMLSWMKREAVEGGLMQGRGGISMGRRADSAASIGMEGCRCGWDGCGGQSPLWWDATDAKFRHDVRRNSGLGGRSVRGRSAVGLTKQVGSKLSQHRGSENF